MEHSEEGGKTPEFEKAWRNTTQDLAPSHHPDPSNLGYDLFPGFSIGSGKISLGYPELAKALIRASGHSSGWIRGCFLGKRAGQIIARI